MANMTIRNLPDEIHDILREQAYRNSRSIEAEVRSILTSSVIAASGKGFGQHLRQRFADVLGDEMSVERDKTASEPGLFK